MPRTGNLSVFFTCMRCDCSRFKGKLRDSGRYLERTRFDLVSLNLGIGWDLIWIFWCQFLSTTVEGGRINTTFRNQDRPCTLNVSSYYNVAQPICETTFFTANVFIQSNPVECHASGSLYDSGGHPSRPRLHLTSPAIEQIVSNMTLEAIGVNTLALRERIVLQPGQRQIMFEPCCFLLPLCISLIDPGAGERRG